MGGRGSGGGRSGGGGGASKSAPISKETENQINYLLNQSYKYDDDAYEFKQRAKGELAMANQYRKKGNLKSAEKYEGYAKDEMAKSKKAEKKAKELRKEANKLAPQEVVNIPRTYSYKGEDGSRSVYKSLQTAKEHWKQRKANTVSTAYADSPTIVKSPNGGYSVVPHKIARINQLKVISPYRIQDDD